jgi:hypothetical protein
VKRVSAEVDVAGAAIPTQPRNLIGRRDKQKGTVVVNGFTLLTACPAKEGMGKVVVEGVSWSGLETRECETSSDTLVGRRGSGGGCGCGRGARCCKLASGQRFDGGRREEERQGRIPLVA